MVDGFGRGLVVISVDGGFEVGNVEDVGGGVVVGSRFDFVLFIEFVVEEEEGLVFINELVLVRVGIVFIGSVGDDGGG